MLKPPYDRKLQRADTEYVIKKLGLTADSFRAIMTGPKRTFHDFPSYATLRRGQPYLISRAVYGFAKSLAGKS